MPDMFVKDGLDWELFAEDWAEYCSWLEEDRNDAEMEIQYQYAKQEGLINVAS